MKPFDRLKFWKVPHELIHRLEPYDVSIPHLSVFRGQSFPSLRIWALLLETAETELEPLPYWTHDPEEWFGRVEA